jgi:hypothetical protein
VYGFQQHDKSPDVWDQRIGPGAMLQTLVARWSIGACARSVSWFALGHRF